METLNHIVEEAFLYKYRLFLIQANLINIINALSLDDYTTFITLHLSCMSREYVCALC